MWSQYKTLRFVLIDILLTGLLTVRSTHERYVLYHGLELPIEFGDSGWVQYAHWPDACWQFRIATLELPFEP